MKLSLDELQLRFDEADETELRQRLANSRKRTRKMLRNPKVEGKP